MLNPAEEINTSQRTSVVVSHWVVVNQRRFALILMALVALLDQLTKIYVVAFWGEGSARVVIPGFFNLVHICNTGAAWGILSGRPFLLGLISIVVMMFVFWKFTEFVEGRILRIIAMGCVLGGIYGNLIDRLFRGEVVDFLLFFYRGYYWPAFNIADSAICCGVAVFLFSSFRPAPYLPKKQDETRSAEPRS